MEKKTIANTIRDTHIKYTKPMATKQNVKMAETKHTFVCIVIITVGNGKRHRFSFSFYLFFPFWRHMQFVIEKLHFHMIWLFRSFFFFFSFANRPNFVGHFFMLLIFFSVFMIQKRIYCTLNETAAKRFDRCHFCFDQLPLTVNRVADKFH